MNRITKTVKIYLIVCITIWIVTTSVTYASDPATFATLYNPKAPTNYWGMAFWGVAAGALVFFTGGLASAFIVEGVSAIGSTIGGLMGYTGVAATNAGLALLGGGSLAAGGLGMTGGAALLTASLTFSGEVIIDKSMNFMSQKSVQLSDASRGRVDLPYPVYKKGSKVLRYTSEFLEKNINRNEILDNAYNRSILKKAFHKLKAKKHSGSLKNNLQINSAMSLILFILDDYEGAYKQAKWTWERAGKNKEVAPVAQYIMAVSSLNHDHAHEGEHFKHLTQALLTEKNQVNTREFERIIYYLIAVYADRLQLKMLSDDIGPIAFQNLISFVKTLRLTRYSTFQTFYPIATRHIMMLKVYQMKITSLTQSENETIAKSPKTLKILRKYLANYEHLLENLVHIIDEFKLVKRLQGKKYKDVKNNIYQIQNAFKRYHSDINRLKRMISTFENQRSLPESQTSLPNDSSKAPTSVAITLAIGLIALLIFKTSSSSV